MVFSCRASTRLREGKDPESYFRMSLISNFFHAWERRLAYRDDHQRRVLDFDWGAEYLGADGNGAASSHRALAGAVELA